MPTVQNFLVQHGNKTFKEMPFCETDLYVLCLFGYADIRRTDVNKKFDLINSLAPLKIFRNESEMDVLTKKYLSPTRGYSIFIHRLIKSKRYEDVLFGYIDDKMSRKANCQFFGITFMIDNKVVVCFRGTDDSVAGWIEDLEMISDKIIPARIESKKYIRKILGLVDKNITIIGHSKGGNLAYYSYFNSSKKNKLRIDKVYNFDGQGFMDDEYDYSEYGTKLIKIVPSDDIVGLLMDNSTNFEIVHSSSLGVMAHDMLTWGLDADNTLTNFFYVKKRIYLSQALEISMKIWMNNNRDNLLVLLKFFKRLFKVNNESNIKSFVFDAFFKEIDYYEYFRDYGGEDKEIIINTGKDFIKTYIDVLLHINKYRKEHNVLK